MDANERTQNSLIESNHAAGLHTRTLRGGRLLALLGCMAALAGCAGSHENERPAATVETEPGARAAIDTQGNPPGERVDPTSSEQRSEAVTDLQAAEARRNSELDTRGRPVSTAETSTQRSAAAASNTVGAPAGTGTGTARGTATGTGAPARDADDTDRRDADNTDRNERDRNDATLTPMDQSNSSSDVDLTANIRKAVVGDDTLSFNAKNVKIIADGGKVTLRGPVKSAAEKARIEAHANKFAAGRVTSQLEIEK
jgi:osmotically-inducible protein OsmY